MIVILILLKKLVEKKHINYHLQKFLLIHTHLKVMQQVVQELPVV